MPAGCLRSLGGWRCVVRGRWSPGWDKWTMIGRLVAVSPWQWIPWIMVNNKNCGPLWRCNTVVNLVGNQHGSQPPNRCIPQIFRRGSTTSGNQMGYGLTTGSCCLFTMVKLIDHTHRISSTDEVMLCLWSHALFVDPGILCRLRGITKLLCKKFDWKLFLKFTQMAAVLPPRCDASVLCGCSSRPRPLWKPLLPHSLCGSLCFHTGLGCEGSWSVGRWSVASDGAVDGP